MICRYAQQFVKKYFAEAAVNAMRRRKRTMVGGSTDVLLSDGTQLGLMRKASGLRLTASSL